MRKLGAAGHRPPSNVVLDEKQLPVWSMTSQGFTALFAEAIRRRTQDLHIAESYIENSIFHCVDRANQFDILLVLLETRTLLADKPNCVLRTPLHLIALEDNIDATNHLIEYGADTDLRDRWGDEALPLAKSNWHLGIVLELIKAGANVGKEENRHRKAFLLRR